MTTGIERAQAFDNQPIGGGGAATLFHESRWLTEWVAPNSLEVQAEYENLTKGLASDWDKILACFNRVLDIPYTSAVRIKVSVDGRTFVQEDAWLDPAQALMAPKLNCSNRSFVLASLLRQEHTPEQVWVTLGNLKLDGLGGHAWVLLRGNQDYIMETTSPRIRTPITHSEAHEAVVFFNDREVRVVPGRQVTEPFSSCWCIPFLEDYLDKRACYNLK